MNIRPVIDFLNKEYEMNASADYYNLIWEWRQWWAGYVKSFHAYQERMGDGSSRKRTLYSLKMPKKVCEDWASMLLNEKTRLTIGDKTSSEFIQGDDENKEGGVFGDIGFWSAANQLVEMAFFSGTGAFLCKVDGIVARDDGAVTPSPRAKIRIEYIPADHIIPLTRSGGKVTEAAFVSEKTVRGKMRVYLEVHLLEEGGYVIHNHMFEMTNGNLSKAECDGGMPSVFHSGSPHPLFALFSPNIVNPYEGNMGLGCSVFSQAISCLKGVDLAFNNFCRDFWLGGKKVFYNRELTKTTGVDADGNPIYVAPDEVMQQLFISVSDGFKGGDGNTLIHEFNPSLRVDDNADGVQAMLDYISFRCGLGTRHYKFNSDSRSIVTATQYTGEKQELRQNAAKHSIPIQKAIQNIVRAMLWIGKNIIGKPVNPEARISVMFADGYIISDEEQRERDRLDVRDGIMQTWEYRVKHYGEDEVTAKANTQPPDTIFGQRSFPPREDGA